MWLRDNIRRFFDINMRQFIAWTATAYAVAIIVGMVQNYTPVLLLDTWSEVQFYIRLAEGDWWGWWEQHNEHRIVLTRVLFWIDFKFFNGAGIFLLLVNYGLLGISTCIMLKTFRKANALSSEQCSSQLLELLLFCFMFSWMQKDNLILSFQSHFFLAYLLPLLAFYNLSKLHLSSKKNHYFVYATALGIVSVGTMANGVLVLPLLTLMAVIIGLRLWHVLILFLLSLSALWLYFYDYQISWVHGSVLESVIYYPWAMAHYYFLYMGAPFFYLTASANIALFAGVLFSLLLVTLGAWLLCKRSKNSIELMMLIFVLYITASAIATAGGRLVVGVDQALTSRYTTPVIQAWISLLILAVPYWKRFMQGKIWRYLSTAIILLTLYGLLLVQLEALKNGGQRLFAYEIARLAIQMGVKDRQQIQAIFPAPEPLLKMAINPRVRTLSFVHNSAVNSYLNTPVNSLPRRANCLGNVDLIEAVENDERYFRISGWLYSGDAYKNSRLIEVLGANNEIVGFVHTGAQRIDLLSHISEGAEYAGFMGYIKAFDKLNTLVFYDKYAGCELKLTIKPNVLENSQSTNANIFVWPDKSEESVHRDVVNQEKWCASQFTSSYDVPWVINYNGTVVDSGGKLMWKQCSEGRAGKLCDHGVFLNIEYDNALNLYQSVNAAEGFAGFRNWRLPTDVELFKLQKFQCAYGRNNFYFPNASPFEYWTDSSAAKFGYYAWDVLFSEGYHYWINHYNKRNVRLVRNVE